MALDGLTDAFDGLLDGRVDRAAQRRPSASPASRAGRVRRRQPPAGRRRAEERRASPRRSRRSTIPQRKGEPIVDQRGRGRPAGHHRRDAGQAASGVRRGRHDHRRHRPRRSPTAPRAVVVMSKAKAEELGLTWLAEIGAHGNVAGPDNSLHSQPANAIQHALGKQGSTVGRPRPDRDQRGVRRGRHPVDPASSASARRSSTSTAARSPSATRSACPAPGWC